MFAGGYAGAYSNVIDYVTIASIGNATDFGDLTVARRYSAGAANTSRAVFGGGTAGDYRNEIDYVTINTIGNAVDFGDLTLARYSGAALSNGHGGL